MHHICNTQRRRHPSSTRTVSGYPKKPLSTTPPTSPPPPVPPRTEQQQEEQQLKEQVSTIIPGEGEQVDTGMENRATPVSSYPTLTPAQQPQQQQRLLSLRHASKCTHVEGKCPQGYGGCKMMKELWKHIGTCREQKCLYPQCMASRYVLSYYQKCKNSDCPVCGPVRNTIRSHKDSHPVSHPGVEARHVPYLGAEAGEGGGWGVLAQQQQRRILVLHHGLKCTHVDGECPQKFSNCNLAKELYKHIKECREPDSCPYPRCVVYRYALYHYRTCKDSNCIMCVPVRNTIVSSRAASGSLPYLGEIGGEGGGGGGVSLPGQQQQQQQQQQEQEEKEEKEG